MRALLAILFGIGLLVTPRAESRGVETPKTGIDEKGSREKLQESAIPWLGVLITNTKRGVMVTRVYDKTPAKKAGMKRGDLLVALERRQLADVDSAVTHIRGFSVGKIVEVFFSSGGILQQAKIKLAERPAHLQDQVLERRRRRVRSKWPADSWTIPRKGWK